VVQLTGRSIELETPEVHARGTGGGVHVAELAGSVAGSTATVNCLRTISAAGCAGAEPVSSPRVHPLFTRGVSLSIGHLA
jgi:hypothetical protein